MGRNGVGCGTYVGGMEVGKVGRRGEVFPSVGVIVNGVC